MAQPLPGAEATSVPILVPDERGELVLDEQALRSVLLRDEVRHLPVVVVAVAGAFRRGKSFLLSFLLRFLEANGAADWLGSPDRPLDGFAWHSGRQRHTVGIHMAARPTRVRLPTGQEVAVVLMDTQGAFDRHSTVGDNAAVFALSALTSSVQVFNVAGNIGADDLQHLQQFAELGRVAADAGQRAFQRLVFLVRDWQAPGEAAYGHAGGRQVLAEALDCSADVRDELRQMRQHVRRCFSDVDCFLMPHPGKAVATSAAFDGRLRDIEPEFLQSLDELARLLLSPEQLVLKRSQGRTLTAADLVAHFQTFSATLRSGALPQPRSLVDTMAEANNLSGVSSAVTLYAERMQRLCSVDSAGVPQHQLDECHTAALDTALKHFEQQKRMHGVSDAAQYRQKLLDGVDNWRTQFFEANSLKNQLTEARSGLNCNRAYVEARDAYSSSLSHLMQGTAVDDERLQQEHHVAHSQALDLFDTATADCQRETRSEHRQRLLQDLEYARQEAELFNSRRREGEVAAVDRDRQALGNARQRYRSILQECVAGGPVADETFETQQQRAEREARHVFQSGRDQQHPTAPQLDELFQRSLHQEAQVQRSGNVFERVIGVVLPLLTPLITKAVARCVVM